MTKNERICDRAVMMSVTMPSAKYSWLGSPLRFWNGSTAIEGRSGSASAGFQDAALSDAAGRIRNARTGERMPLTRCSPMSSNSASNRPRVLSRTEAETTMPPGSARASSRAATLTPSP